MDYSEFSVGNAADFLQSVTIIDDQFLWGTKSTDSVATALSPPEKDEFKGSLEKLAVTSSLALDGAIDLKSIVRGFSENGVVCCPYEWTEHDDEPPMSAHKSDVVIFDWKLVGDQLQDGSLVSGFIKKILDQDSIDTPRLRFVSIYSSEKPTEIFDTLCKELQENYKIERHNDFLDIELSDAAHAVRLQYISKSDVSENELANALIERFSSFVEGFLPNIVLSAVTEIRERSFEYLARFHKGLDMAILSHYSALRSQKDAFPTAEGQFRDYVSNLIGNSVLDSLTYSQRVKEASSYDKIEGYLKSKNPVVMGLDTDTVLEDKRKILDILGTENHEGFISLSISELDIRSGKKKKFQGGKVPLVFDPVGSNDRLELTQLDLQKNLYKGSDSSPILRLGSIVELDDTFYVCTQPLCEGVRLAKDIPHKFSFIRLKEVVGDNTFFFVVCHNGSYRKFKNETRQQHLKTFSFKSDNDTKDVRAKWSDSQHAFVTAGDDKLNWLGELKDIYSQELLHRLASAASRVGSDKYEWMRLQQP